MRGGGNAPRRNGGYVAATPAHEREKQFLFVLLVLILAMSFPPFQLARASSNPQMKLASDTVGKSSGPNTRWYNAIEGEWGGHVKVRGSVSWPEDESYFRSVGTGSYYDGNAEARVKGKVFFADWGDFVCHYEAVASGGDTRRKRRELERRFPGLFSAVTTVGGPPSDRRRLMDLTSTVDEDDTSLFYHRLDRLYMTFYETWGSVRLGRQAITWGNGLLFNPMDLFNPFSPSDIEREYKSGDDMASGQFSLGSLGDVQVLCVPRREVESGSIKWDESSGAAKLRFRRGTIDFDVMGAQHYRDTVFGVGMTGYWGDAAWRCDAVYTFLDERGGSGDYLSLVVNMDYSWVWWNKNFYGYVEYYFNGLSHSRYTDALADPNIADRIGRGELFVLGRNYLGGHIKSEVHPLVNVFLTVIANLEDPSGSLQPRAVWDIAQNVQITIGGTIFFGGTGTEYGGFKVAGTDFLNKPSHSAFLWLAYYF